LKSSHWVKEGVGRRSLGMPIKATLKNVDFKAADGTVEGVI